MFLDDEAVALALELAALGLPGFRKVALAIVSVDVQRRARRHDYALLRSRAFSGSFLAVAFLAVAFFGFAAAALPFFSSPRLFFSAAIRSMTFEPLGGAASASGSSMIFSPFFFCFSSMRR